jgi:glutamate-1-semialdehyde 2,1-aminomutase
MADTSTSRRLFARAQAVIPGGVNSPTRAFAAVGGTPRFIRRGEGATIEDVDGNRYLDLVGSWGPLLFGHARREVLDAAAAALERGSSFGAPIEAEIELAEQVIAAVPSIEKVRLTNSGTEAAMSAVRLARGATGRAKILKFVGHYHGHADALLVAAGSGVATLGIPGSPGVTAGAAADTILVPWNDRGGERLAVDAHGDDLAAILCEPVPANMNLVAPEDGLLALIRDEANRSGALLVFDEVISGFRLARGGAQEVHGVTPDLTVLGKVLGGGFPLAAVGGRAEVMDHFAPVGAVYQAGTLSGRCTSGCGRPPTRSCVACGPPSPTPASPPRSSSTAPWPASCSPTPRRATTRTSRPPTRAPTAASSTRCSTGGSTSRRPATRCCSPPWRWPATRSTGCCRRRRRRPPTWPAPPRDRAAVTAGRTRPSPACARTWGRHLPMVAIVRAPVAVGTLRPRRR